MPNALIQLYRKSLSDQGVDDPRDDLLVMRDFLGPLAQENPELLSAYPDFSDEWREIRLVDSPGTMRGIVNTAKTAFQRSRQSLNAIGGVDAEDVASLERDIQDRPSSVPWEDFQRSDGKNALKVFLRDPIEITANIITSGFTGSLPALGGGLSAGAVGAALGGPAAPVTGAIGAAIGTGAGSLAVEYGGKYLEVLREAGADLADADSIRRVLEDPEVRTRARSMAFRRGVPVAVFDAASAGIAGRIFKGIKGATGAQIARRGGAEALIQGGLGGGGEVAGALSAGEEISPRAVFEEVVGELGPGVVEVGGAAMRRRIAAPTDVALPPPPPITGPPAAPTSPLVEPIIPSAPTVVAPPVRSNADIVLAVEAMDATQIIARMAELQAIPARTEEQEIEMQLLVARAPSSPVAPPVVAPLATTPPEAAATSSLVEPVIAPPPPAAVGTPVEAPVAGPVASTPTAAVPSIPAWRANAPTQLLPELIAAGMDEQSAIALINELPIFGGEIPASVLQNTPEMMRERVTEVFYSLPGNKPPARQPDSDYLYNVQRAAPDALPYVQIDAIVNGGRGEPLTDAQRAALPQPPGWLPSGQYTLAQIVEANQAQPPSTPVTPQAPELVPPAILTGQTAWDAQSRNAPQAAKKILSVEPAPFKSNTSDGNWGVAYETESKFGNGRQRQTKHFFKKADAQQWIRENMPAASVVDKPAAPVPPKEAAPIVAAQTDLPRPSEIPPVVASTTATPEERAAAIAVEPVEPTVTPLLTAELLSRPELPELAGRMVQLEALTDGGERVVAEIDAAQAWSDTQKQIGIYRRLLDCLKGAA